MSEPVIQYFRCPEHYVSFALKGSLSETSGYFRFGADTVYGRYCGGNPSNSSLGPLQDASLDTTVKDGKIYLPFDVAQVIDSLRYERYAQAYADAGSAIRSAIRPLYYFVRPLLHIGIRKHLQKFHLSDWHKLSFPAWPVDRTVDNVFEQLLLLSLRATGVNRIPFIWFWPDGAQSCAIMTHDVETTRGINFSATLMDIDDSFGISASFQVVPERRYEVTPTYLETITKRGFDLCVQDLNHDGHLYKNRRQFIKRAAKINSYGRLWGADGFRAAVLYRRQDWFDALDFSYDMSVPNVAHLDPQRGGCCTVMPYAVGRLLELPVTTTQDYPLFHILKDYSIGLWKQQIELIMAKHGLISFIIHPDYIVGLPERRIYEALLAHLVQLRQDKGVWIAKPSEVNLWWRERAKMKIIEDGEDVRIEGPGRERARIAYASEKDGRLVFTVERQQSSVCTM